MKKLDPAVNGRPWMLDEWRDLHQAAIELSSAVEMAVRDTPNPERYLQKFGIEYALVRRLLQYGQGADLTCMELIKFNQSVRGVVKDYMFLLESIFSCVDAIAETLPRLNMDKKTRWLRVEK